MLLQMMKVSILCGIFRFIRFMEQYIELRAVQVALNERIELSFVGLYQLMDSIGKCGQKAASFTTIDTACRHGMFHLRHGARSYAIGIPKPVQPTLPGSLTPTSSTVSRVGARP